MEDYNIEIGYRLKQIRNNKNLSQREVAKAVDIDHSYIAKMEKGHVPSLSVLFTLAEYYHIDISYLLTGKEENQILRKWEPVIKLFEEKGIEPEEIIQLLSLMKKMY